MLDDNGDHVASKNSLILDYQDLRITTISCRGLTAVNPLQIVYNYSFCVSPFAPDAISNPTCSTVAVAASRISTNLPS